jgi:hypothetical protein
MHEAGLVWFGHTGNAPQSIKRVRNDRTHLGFAEPLMFLTNSGIPKGEYLHWGFVPQRPASIDVMIKEAARKTYLNQRRPRTRCSSVLAPKFKRNYATLSEPDLMSYFPEEHVRWSCVQAADGQKLRAGMKLADFSVLRPNDKKYPMKPTGFVDSS